MASLTPRRCLILISPAPAVHPREADEVPASLFIIVVNYSRTIRVIASSRRRLVQSWSKSDAALFTL